MGTLRGYSVNTPCSISRDCSPTPRWLKTPNKQQKCAFLCHALKRWKTVTQYTENESLIDISGTGIILFTGYQP